MCVGRDFGTRQILAEPSPVCAAALQRSTTRHELFALPSAFRVIGSGIARANLSAGPRINLRKKHGPARNFHGLSTYACYSFGLFTLDACHTRLGGGHGPWSTLT